MTHRATIGPRLLTDLNRLFSVCNVLMILLCRIAGASANTLPSEQFSRFHLRFGVGLVATAQASAGENEPVALSSAPGILDGVQVGGRVTKNLSIFFEGDSLIMFQKEDVAGVDSRVGQNARTDRTLVYGFLTGIGVGYRVQPADVLLSAALGVALSDVVFGNDTKAFEPGSLGMGFSAMVGKDWWSSRGLNVGFGGQFLYLATQGEYTDRLAKHTLALGVLLVASFD